MNLQLDSKTLTRKIGTIVVISAPSEFSPKGLDWSRWILNTSVNFNQFGTKPPKKIMVLDAKGVEVEHMQGVGLEFNRRDLQSLDPLTLLNDENENVLNLFHGSWDYSLSSWVESILTIANAIHSREFKKLHENQFENWKILCLKYYDESYFVISGAGSKFSNAAVVCRGWTDRISRSRNVNENTKSSWCGGLFQLLGSDEDSDSEVTIQRILILRARDWCGDPSWGKTHLTHFGDLLRETEEAWISVPGSGLVLEILNQLKLTGMTDEAELFSPSVVVGWHPVRDFVLCTGSKRDRIFIYLDYQENLHFLFLKNKI